MKNNCPDCGVGVGDLHESGCDVERCPACGIQAIQCFDYCECPNCSTEFVQVSCDESFLNNADRLPWSGEWPGKHTCRELGWYCKLVPGKGWVSCDKSDPDATEDLNRLETDAIWDKEQKCFTFNEVGGM